MRAQVTLLFRGALCEEPNTIFAGLGRSVQFFLANTGRPRAADTVFIFPLYGIALKATFVLNQLVKAAKFKSGVHGVRLTFEIWDPDGIIRTAEARAMSQSDSRI